MTRVVTAAAPANIAFVKYWGSRDGERGVPLNASISMTLTRCRSVCTAEFHPGEDGGDDEVWLAPADAEPSPAPEPFAAPVLVQLQRIRRWASASGRFRVATRNTFPTGTGLASSASGFAALTLAAASAAGREPSPEELSDLARRSGSGSAARSAYGGFVEWPAPETGVEPPTRPGGMPTAGPYESTAIRAAPIASHEHWDLRDVIAVVGEAPKAVSSREGHRRVLGSPYFETRLALLPGRLAEVRKAIEARDFDRLVPVLEAEAVDLHFLAMSARPPIHYWLPHTVTVIDAVRALRDEGTPAAWTMDAGPNVHVICPADAEEAVAGRVSGLEGVRSVIRDRVGRGPETGAGPLL